MNTVNLDMALLGAGVVMIAVGFIYLLVLKNRGYADNRQRWIASGLTLGGFALLLIASKKLN